jgi:hypothetical protein
LGFAFFVAMTVAFAFFAAAVPRRRPGAADRVFGDEYRRVELGAAYLMRLTPLIPGGMFLSEQAFGLDPDRPGHLLLVVLICAMAVLILRLRPVAPPPAGFHTEQRLGA